MTELVHVRLRRETHQALKRKAETYGYKEWALADKIKMNISQRVVPKSAARQHSICG